MKNIAYCLIGIAVMAVCAGCRHEEKQEKDDISGIKFSESSKSLSVGDVATIGILVTPVKAKNQGRVAYSVSRDGIVEIKEGSSNDGVIIEAKSRGTVVVTGRISGFVDYCSITVTGSDERVIPHIISPVSVMEAPQRERRSITVSLAGGSPIDNSGFTWSYTNQGIINFESTGNVGVFDTLAPGASVITVRHPKAQYAVDILVYVLGSGENPVYITGSSNVIDLRKDSDHYEFQVDLIGGLAEDNGRFVYQIIEGSNYIALNGNGRFGTITPKTAGLALIRITHPAAQYPFDIQVVVSEELEYRYIDVDKTLVLLNEGENTVIQAKFSGDAPDDVADKYNFSLSESGIIDVSRSQGLFFINAVKRGKAILSVSNAYADFDREILVVVNNPVDGIVDNQKYIYTNQNVITMEAGGSDSVLRMMLVGGNEADKNSFTWTVDDSSIISVDTAHGNVQYRSMYRALLDNVPYEQFQAEALVSAKKTGTAKITLAHPKAKNEAVVLVKVYPKGTFAAVPVVLGGQPYYKVERGTGLEIELAAVSGNANNIGDIRWSMSNAAVAGIEYTGLNGIIRGLSNGITTLTVSGGNLKQPFSAVIIVNNASELNNQKFIYVLNPFMTLTVGQSVMTGIMSVNMNADEIKTISHINNDNAVVAVHSSGNQMMLTALKPGVAEIAVQGNETNEIKISVTVEEPKVNPDQPFYLTAAQDIMGVVKGQPVDIGVTLVGGSAIKYESSIIWSIENSQIAAMMASGPVARVTGLAEGQTVMHISHPKSANELDIIIFVVANSGDLNNKVALYVEKNNYLMAIGEKIGLSVKTNATPLQQTQISWNIDNLDVIHYEVSADKTTAFITGLKTGTAKVSVSHSQNITTQVVYISVVAKKQGLKYISVPSIIETVAGTTMKIQAATNNLSDQEVREIEWSIDHNALADIAGNGESCILQARSNGSAVITVSHAGMGFVKTIAVYIYSSYEEMASSYVMGCEQSFYRINRGDLIDVSLVFGAKGFPEHEINNIRWSASNNNTVQVSGNGKKAGVKALNSGIAYVYAESDAAKNRKVIFEIEVLESSAVNGGYRIDIAGADRIKGIVVGSFAEITVRIYNGTTEVFSGLNKIQFEAENTDVVGLTAIDNYLRVTAKKAGQSYITVSHPQVAGSERILIYTAGDATALALAYPLFFEKSNYLLKKGTNATVKAETIDNDPAQWNKIKFEVEGHNNVISIAEVSKKEIIISALDKGNDVILVSYNGIVVYRIYVSVTLTVDSDLSTYLMTENIIGMVAGTTRATKISTNMESYQHHTLSWTSDNYGIVGVESYDGITADLTAHTAGQAYITVKAGSLERKMLVFVCNSEAELRAYEAVNIEQRYYVINKGQSFMLNMYSFQGKVEGVTQYADYYSGGDFGGVIELSNKTAGSVTVNGRQEGLAGIRISSPYYHFEIVVYIEVWDVPGLAGLTSTGNYITAGQTLFVIEPYERDVRIKVDVIGDSFYQSGYFAWDNYDRSVIEVRASGSEAYINPVKNGQTVIIVRNAYCDNELPITVIVGSRYNVETSSEPYIYAAKTIYEMSVNDPPLYAYYEMRNSASGAYGYVVGGDSASVNYGASGRLIVSPQRPGMTTVTVSAAGVTSVNFYFIVREHELAETVYLTTDNNFVIGSVNEIKAVDIQLMGYNEIDSNQFKWSIDKKQVALVVGNGNRGQIYPVAEGDAVITVTHYKARFPLTINLRVAKNTVADQLVYLTTQTNVIEALVGEENYIYVQKKGGMAHLNSCMWTVDNPSVVSVSGNENTGIFRIKKAGVARINVTNVEAVYPLQIVVIAKDSTGSPLYITASDTLLEMVPGEMYRRVSVNLAGGGETDNARFNWSVYHQNPTDIAIAKSGGNVVTLVANADQCNITAINEGTARIRVSHEKADNPLYITVQVSRYQQIAFPYNQKQMMVGDSEFIRIDMPNYENFKEKVIFVSDNPEVCTMMGNSAAALLTAHGKGFAIVKARIEGKDQEAELYVTVVEEEDPDTNRIAVGKTSYAFHPRSNPVTIRAQVFGLNMIDSENDHIWWELINLDNSNNPVLDIYPVQAMDKERGSREIQISPRREGEAQIVIGHRYVNPKYYKTISILVSEVSNALTLDKTLVDLTIGTAGQTQMLKATLIGAKPKDYDDIQWLVDTKLTYDGTREEVVRIMGEGQNVMLYAISDGTVEVTARYKGLFATCTVTVKSQYLFSVQARSVRMYPGAVVDVGYDVRPVDSFIVWYSSDYGAANPVLRYEEITGQKILRITGLREGSAQIQGISNGKRALINVMVNYDYKLMADAYVPLSPVLSPADEPTVIKYTVYPPNTWIEADIPAAIRDKVNVTIEKPAYISAQEPAEGNIYLTALSEIQPVEITWKQIKEDGAPSGKTAVTIIAVEFNPKEKIQPYFVRYDGAWSNAVIFSSNGMQKAVPNNPYIVNGATLGEAMEKKGGNGYSLSIGDGENHYIVFDRLYPNSYFEIDKNVVITGSLPHDFKAEIVDIMHNGNMTKVLRLYGGADDIVYNRAAFTKRLYVDIRSPYAPSKNGATNITATISYTRLWINEKTVNKQTGWRTEYEQLWETKKKYAYEIRNAYSYTYDQVSAVAAYIPAASFVKLTDIPDVNTAGIPNAGLLYISDENQFDLSALAGYPYVATGIPLTVTREREGYFYPRRNVEDNPWLFYGLTPQTEIGNTNANYIIYLQGVEKPVDVPVYQQVPVYVYDYTKDYEYDEEEEYDYLEGEWYLDNQGHARKGRFEQIADMNNDEYSNKPFILQQIQNMAGYNAEYRYSFDSYYSKGENLEAPLNAAPQESEWDVFSDNSPQEWSNRLFKFAENPNGVFDYKTSYTGVMVQSTDYVSVGIIYDGIPRVRLTSGYAWENITSGNQAQGTSEYAFFLGATGGNRSNKNIFGSLFNNTESGEEGADWSPQYFTQAQSRSSTRGWGVHSSSVYVQHRYVWKKQSNICIVPIKKMLQFPFYIKPVKIIWDRKGDKSSVYSLRTNIVCNYPEKDRFIMDFQKAPGSTPMPSIDTKVDKIVNDTAITVRYKLFGDQDFRTMTFYVTFESRKCHHAYNGNIGYTVGLADIDNYCNTAGLTEVQGETDWAKLETTDRQTGEIRPIADTEKNVDTTDSYVYKVKPLKP